ncbi:hypothetical protein T440DRAFT_287176 [Plenodomus tracheiphilus IPT5]|uniref:Uncharacterized protein n=1 Tax=Plenodomus tracheiphilus IPT5 TaxID=1408161 RepID=A0A6A7BE99_9PLEO|nr:hypothetical protein T440DRAFT_287176 [Plenodomus tracheiphilus IPT5]
MSISVLHSLTLGIQWPPNLAVPTDSTPRRGWLYNGRSHRRGVRMGRVLLLFLPNFTKASIRLARFHAKTDVES